MPGEERRDTLSTTGGCAVNTRNSALIPSVNSADDSASRRDWCMSARPTAVACNSSTSSSLAGKPALVILDTIKGKGVSFAENVATYHNGMFDEAKFTQAVKELAAQQESV